MELFRDTRHDPPGGRPRAGQAAPHGTAAHAAGVSVIPEQSRFLRRFLQRSSPGPEPARSGLAGLDRHLGGGFGGGLHLVMADRTAGRTAFLESLAWEAVGHHRPTLYLTLKDGGLAVWQRLVVTLAAITGADGIGPSMLSENDLAPEQRETLLRLDAGLQASVLPYLSLVDRPPGPPDDLSGFLDRLRSRSQEAAEQHGRLPLVLVDDLEGLTALTASRSPLHLLSALDSALAADSLPGVITAGSGGSLAREIDHLPVRTVLSLQAMPTGVAGSERVELELKKNTATGWTGSISLLLDPSSGLFAEATRAG